MNLIPESLAPPLHTNHKVLCYRDLVVLFGQKLAAEKKMRVIELHQRLQSLPTSINCRVIVFEHLGNLRPQGGKYSARSNQKRAYWLKSKIVDNTSHIARTRFNILTSRVSPKNTSKYSAIDRTELIRTSEHQLADLLANNQKIWLTRYNNEKYTPGLHAIAQNGYWIHSGLNAARNIGIKFYQRSQPDAKFMISKSLGSHV